MIAGGFDLAQCEFDFLKLKYLLAERDERLGTDAAELLGLSSRQGVVPRTSMGDSVAIADSLEKYKRVSVGQIVMNKMQAWNGAFALSAHDGVVSPDYTVLCFAGLPCEPRYIEYVMRTPWFAGRCAAIARGIGTGFLRVNTGDLLSLRIPYPAPEAQAVIADFLDRETARIDALIAAKQRMMELLDERWQRVLETTIQALVAHFGEIPLKYLCREVVVGIVITPSAWYAESGIPAIRGTNVSPGAISLDDLVYLTPEGHALHQKSRLRSGDVVVVRTGQAGAAAVVPPGLEDANCIDLVIIRLASGYSPQFLEYVLNSDWMQKHIDQHSVGTIQSHFNVGAASNVPVPRASEAAQDAAVADLRAQEGRVKRTVGSLRRQVEVLQERRQSLIASMVTGQREAGDPTIRQAA